MRDRQTNTELFRQLVDSEGDTGKAKLSIGAKVSTSLIDKMYADTYGRCPKESNRERICAYYKVNEDKLFPFVTSKRTRAA